MQPAVCADGLNRRDGLACGRTEAHDARSRRLPVDHHGAGAAVSFAAPELASGESEILAQDGEQAIARVALNPVGLAVDAQDELGHQEILAAPWHPEPT